jgi:type II restriction/modification system DNA methylase subunit YeeA
MTAQEFVQKWAPSELRERQGSQEHFLDLCRLLDEPTPAEADPSGKKYCFDAGVEKTTGEGGFADVWKKGCFGWEYKGKHKNLTDAYAQLQRYADSLLNPPLLIVSDMDEIVIHTNFTNTVHEVHRIFLSDLLLVERRRLLKWAFTDPMRLRPGLTARDLTEKAARQFAEIAQRLRTPQGRYDPQRVAHFMNKVLFCMFAEHIGLLGSSMFTRLLRLSSRKPALFADLAGDLFRAMKDGGRLGLDEVDWFNGGLFDTDDVVPLGKTEIDQILKVSELDWSSIEPSIFGTLFERGLDPDKRSQLGAHFTDPQSIMRIVEPVVLAPLRLEWANARGAIARLMQEYRDLVAKIEERPETRIDWNLSKEEIARLLAEHKKPRLSANANRIMAEAKEKCRAFLSRLESFRVLDPACGSGNFLYLALQGLKDLEQQVIKEIEGLGLQGFLPSVGPQSVMGIEVNVYAAELARVTIWIGQIQWMLRHGWGLSKNPILKPLDQIACRDAVLSPDGADPEWPDADCIIGNPPFLGDKKMISELGEAYAGKLRRLYDGRVPGGADLVTFWFARAWQQIAAGKSNRAGLVATNSIRGGQNRKVLETICTEGRIFEAWSDEQWIADGASVRVSIVCFDGNRAAAGDLLLDNKLVATIHADLTGRSAAGVGLDLTIAKPLRENAGVIFMGTTKVGAFDIPGALAREWLVLPANPNGRPNSDVVRPWANAMDLTRRPSDTWIIDFGSTMSEAGAALYEAPFEYLRKHVQPVREKNRRETYAQAWWRFGETRPALRAAMLPLSRIIATPSVAKHRVFVFLDKCVLPDHAVFVITRDDYVTFGILHSRFHEAWALRTCTWLGVGNDPRYTPSTTFDTFPFPSGLQPNSPAEDFHSDARALGIAQAAEHLNRLRETWLNPPELVRREPEVVPGFPDRLVPVDEKALAELKKRTLTNLYNVRPAWLAQAHRALDSAVAAAYGWPPDIGEDDALSQLLEMNRDRAAAQRLA